MSTATIFGSFPNTAAQPATATTLAPMLDSFAQDDGAPRAEATSVPTAESGPVSTALGAWLVLTRQAFDRWMASNAQSRANARLWDMACSDHRIMGELMHARMRDDSETLVEPVAVLVMPVAHVLEAEPTLRQPHQLHQHTAGQGWGRIIEDAYQNRFHQLYHQHA